MYQNVYLLKWRICIFIFVNLVLYCSFFLFFNLFDYTLFNSSNTGSSPWFSTMLHVLAAGNLAPSGGMQGYLIFFKQLEK